MAAVVCGATIGAFALSFALPVYWRASTSVVPDANDSMRNLGGLAGIAAQFGAPVPSSTQSPQFFADLLRTRSVLHAVLSRRVPTAAPAGHDSATVLDQFAADDHSVPALREDRAIKKLRENLDVKVGARTGIIEISALTRSPVLSMYVARVVVEELDHANVAARTAKARNRREFTEGRLAEARDSLAQAERALEQFSSANRVFRDAPALQLAYTRLERGVSVQSELVSTLRKEYETARLEEVNDTPVLSVLDPPTVPVVRAAPSRRNIAIAGCFAGCAIAFGTLCARAWRTARSPVPVTLPGFTRAGILPDAVLS